MQESLRQKLADYKMPVVAEKLVNSTRIVLLVGVAGAGKNTILNELLEKTEYKFIVSHTTRPPRNNGGVPEKDGIDYNFIDYKKAEDMLDNQEFVEAKNVHGKLYGTSVEAIEQIHKAGKIAITDLDIQGVAEYMAVSSKVVPIFLLPPDFETWQTRLKARYGDGQVDTEDIGKRMQTAKDELQEALNKNYYEFVINDDLSRTVQAVDDIVHGSTSKPKNQKARKLAEQLLAGLNA